MEKKRRLFLMITATGYTCEMRVPVSIRIFCVGQGKCLREIKVP